jgi:hypothetical protein
MKEFHIINKIGIKIDEYQKKTGATKVWIAKQMGYNSPQALDKAIKNNSNSLETYIKFAEFLQCDVKDLYGILKQKTLF